MGSCGSSDKRANGTKQDKKKGRGNVNEPDAKRDEKKIAKNVVLNKEEKEMILKVRKKEGDKIW